MGTTQEEPTLKELVSRLAELEQAHARLQEKLESSSGTAPAAKPPRPGVFASDVAGTPAVSASGTNGADGVDATSDSGTGVSAISGSGTGLVATSSSGLAGHFVGNVTMDNNLNVAGALNGGAAGFASSVAGTPAVKATGTTGADGVDASSDSGTGVSATSGSGTGLVATSSSGLAGHFVGNVTMDNNLNVAGALSTGALNSGAGTFASGVSGTPAVKASGTNGADGVDATSDSGFGIRGDSNTGVGVTGTSQTGDGIHGFSGNSSGSGVLGQNNTGIGIQGLSDTGAGVAGSSNNTGVEGVGARIGVFAQSSSGLGVWAVGGGASPGTPPFGITETAVFAEGGPNPGIVATSGSGTGLVATSSSGLAGHFVGNVTMDNNLNVTGALNSSSGTFTSTGIDVPAGHFVGNVFIDESMRVTGLLDVGQVNVAGFLSTLDLDVGRDLNVGGTLTANTSPVVLGGVSAEQLSCRTADVTSTAHFGGTVNMDSTLNVKGMLTGGGGYFDAGVSGTGVVGQSTLGDGVVGGSLNGNAVHGMVFSGGSGFAGLFDGNVFVNGGIGTSGTKDFVQAHPTDPSREIVYVALEGGEAGTYVRGTGQLVNGKAVLELPEHFRLVTDTQGLTIHLTARGTWLQLYVVELDTAQIVVREAQGQSGTFDYLIHGVRRGYEQHEVIRTKR